MSERPFIVSIVGPSASGKSQLARRAAAELGEVVASRVPADYFFVPREADQSLADFLRQPLRYDWPLLMERIASPLGTIASTPAADFTTFRRLAGSGGRPFTIRPVMLIDAMAACPEADLLIRLDVPDDVRRERLQERDVRWGSNVAANWEHLCATWDAALAEMRSPDMVLNGEQPLEVSARVLAQEVRR